MSVSSWLFSFARLPTLFFTSFIRSSSFLFFHFSLLTCSRLLQCSRKNLDLSLHGPTYPNGPTDLPYLKLS